MFAIAILIRFSLARHILAASALLAPYFQEVEPPDLAGLAAQFLTLGGVAGVIAVLINLGKTAGIVKDGQAPQYSLVLNVIGFVGLAALRLFAPDVEISGLDQTAATIGQILTLVLGLWFQFGATKAANNAVKGLPLIGKSYSKEIEAAELAKFADQARARGSA